MLLEIVLIVLLALLSGFFALSEMALMTSRASRLKHLALQRRAADRALEMTRHPERFLATVQVFITLISIGTGTTLGVMLGDRFADHLRDTQTAWLAPYATSIGVVLSISLITFANMLLGELLPKRIALVNPERIAMATAWPMRILTAAAAPIAFVLIWITRVLLRVMRLDRVKRESVSEEEIRLLVAESAEAGIIDPTEHNMVNRVLRLGDRTAESVMTPRPRIAWLDADAAAAANLAIMRETPYSRYPVYRSNEQQVVGILEVKRLIGNLGARSVPDLTGDLAKPLYVPATARALDLLEEFRDAGIPLALVVDEYGDIEGLVTLNDVLAAVVGAGAASQTEYRNAPIVTREDGSWLVNGGLSIEDLRELLGVGAFPHEDELDFNTAAGLTIAQFGRIPRAGDHFDWERFRFEVVDLDGARIDKLLITRLDNPAATPTATS